MNNCNIIANEAQNEYNDELSDVVLLHSVISQRYPNKYFLTLTIN